MTNTFQFPFAFELTSRSTEMTYDDLVAVVAYDRDGWEVTGIRSEVSVVDPALAGTSYQRRLVWRDLEPSDPLESIILKQALAHLKHKDVQRAIGFAYVDQHLEDRRAA